VSGYIEGVDVYHGDDRIDWNGLFAEGVRFAYIKALEGQSLQDTACLDNFEAARTAGHLCGAYQFVVPPDPASDATVEAMARAQADAFCDDLRVIGGDQLGPTLDLEWSQRPGQRERWSALTLHQRLIVPVAMHHQIMLRTGRHTVWYLGKSFCDELLGGTFPQEAAVRLWVASATAAAAPTAVPDPFHNWLFWQWGQRPDWSSGKGLDADRFAGTADELRQLCHK